MLHSILLAVTIVLAVGYVLCMLRPYLRSIKHEVRGACWSRGLAGHMRRCRVWHSGWRSAWGAQGTGILPYSHSATMPNQIAWQAALSLLYELPGHTLCIVLDRLATASVYPCAGHACGRCDEPRAPGDGCAWPRAPHHPHQGDPIHKQPQACVA